MRALTYLKKNLLNLFLLFFFSLPILILSQESFGRTFILIFSFILWIVLLLCTGSSIKASVLYILVVLPFNITYQLPHSVLIFNTEIVISDPFVNGIYVNYLVPTLSILDLGIFLLLFSVIVEKGTIFINKTFLPYRWYFLYFLIFLFCQNFLLRDFLILLNSLRIFSFLVAFVLLITVLKKKEFFRTRMYVLYILIFHILFQGILGLIQFLRGSSLGLDFLGESQVISGMYGSSFIELNGELFLRAYGTFPHPNILAGFFLLCLFYGIRLFYKKIVEKRKPQIINYLIILLPIIFSLFTFSRIVIFLILFISLSFLLKYFYNTHRRQLFSFTPFFFAERFSNLFNDKDSSLVDRINLLKASFRVFQENFLFGTGFGNFVKAMEAYVPRTSHGILLLQPVHNIFFLLLTELGFLGLIALCILIGRIFILNVHRISFFGYTILISVLFIGFFDHYLISLPQGLAFLGIYAFLFVKESEGL